MPQRALLVFLLIILLCTISAAASSNSGSSGDSATLDRSSALLSLTARQKRFVDHVAQDIQLEITIITSCRDRLQHQIDRTPLGIEPNQQQGVQRLLSWFKSEGPWLQGASRRVDGFQAQLSAGNLIPANELNSFYQEWIHRQQQGGAELESLLGLWEEQRQQLAEALVRRRELIAERERLLERERFHDEKHPDQRHHGHEDEEIEERLQRIDTLLFHLPTVDEVVLADYRLLIEEGEAALNRLNRRKDEHQTVQEQTILLSKSDMEPLQGEAICRGIANRYQQ
ncbi:MAG TPA: hypothetical protein VFR01_01435, partial [Geobacterales bacterium]|nr:hypothetical protein [Geobacterales bacterium]